MGPSHLKISPGPVQMPSPQSPRFPSGSTSPLPLWSPPGVYEKTSKPPTFHLSLSELAVFSTRAKLSRILRPKTLVLMFILTIIAVAFLFLNPGSTGIVPLPLDGTADPAAVGLSKPTITTNLPVGPYADKKHLIVVAGHAIWKGGPMLGEVDEEWTLESFQHGHNESLTWIEHIERGVEILHSDPESILIFSGGETRASSGPRTEAQSYWTLADARNLFTPKSFPLSTTELFARDSFENVLFSICRFKEYTGVYPEAITIIGYEFKRHRFTQVHRPAIRFPENKFTYIGIDHKNQTLVYEMARFEKSHSLVPFQKDPYACVDPVLIEKKKSRGWGGRGNGGYERACPELRPLLEYCGLQEGGSVKLFDGPLPWTN